VTATNELGAKTTTAPDASGQFRLVLHKGHTYRLAVELATGTTEPIVFPRASGLADQTFKISSGAATVGLGAVRHLEAAPAAGFKVKSVASPGTTPAEGNDAECENGVDANTGAACVDDNGELTCDAGHADDHGADGECENGVDVKTGAACTDAPAADDQADGECENGVDAKTGAACTDAPAADDQADGECENGVDAKTGATCQDVADASTSDGMAIAEHNVPDDVGGCDDSGKEEADD
jgi:hypothetical protein